MEKYKKAQALDLALKQFRKNGAYKKYSKELTDADLAILFTIKFADELKTTKLTDVATKLDLTLPAVTHKVNDLEDRGLIIKKVSTRDRRVVNLELTLSANVHLDEIIDSYYEPLLIIMERLGKEDTKIFMKLLLKINNYGKIK